MKKFLLALAAIVVLSVAYWLISPLWRVEKVSEDVPSVAPAGEVSSGTAQNNATTTSNAPEGTQKPEKSDVTVLKTGVFTGFDKIHTGSGTARVLRVGGGNYIRFEQDFTVNNGPDLFVGLGRGGEYIKGSELGKLKGTVGSQNYALPAGVNTEDVQEVWIWCRAFSVPFARAVLH